jgi:branched-chain amino acid transport system ATP-binding protein
MSLLVVNDVTIAFGGIVAARDVSLAIPQGEIRGLIGPNGAGKTSLINAISGVVRPRAGSIVFEGKEITGLPADLVSQRGIGRTFQHVELFREESVVQNVMTGLYRHYRYGVAAAALGFSGKAEAHALGEAMELLTAFDLTPLANARAGDLPFGIQKRIDLARALAVRPRLLLLDEPVSGMSEVEANAAIATARALARERGITLLVVEHNMRVLMELAERITVMHQGRVIAEGEPAEIRADAAVIEAYLGEEELA